MNSKQINNTLIFKGFEEKKIDTGFNYTKRVNENIELVCHLEPGVSLSFIIIYKHDGNQIKGSHILSKNEMERVGPDLDLFFKKAVKSMPQYIGDSKTGIHLHSQIENGIEKAFI